MDFSFVEFWIIFPLVVLGIFYLRTLFAIIDKVVPRYRPKAALDLEAESIEEEILTEGKRRKEIIQKMADLTRSKPEMIASIIKKWLQDNGW